MSDLSEMQHLVQRFLILPALPGLLTQPLDRALSDRTKTCQTGGVTVPAILISHSLYAGVAEAGGQILAESKGPLGSCAAARHITTCPPRFSDLAQSLIRTIFFLC